MKEEAKHLLHLVHSIPLHFYTFKFIGTYILITFIRYDTVVFAELSVRATSVMTKNSCVTI